jgi:Putative viral replication protein
MTKKSKKKSIPRYRAWLITWEDRPGTPDQIKALYDDSLITYVLYGIEIAPTTGWKHLQIYVEMSVRRTYAAMMKYFPKAHVEQRRGSQSQAIEYCKKDIETGGVISLGERIRQGKRNDLKEIINEIENGKPLKKLLAEAVDERSLIKERNRKPNLFES